MGKVQPSRRRVYELVIPKDELERVIGFDPQLPDDELYISTRSELADEIQGITKTPLAIPREISLMVIAMAANPSEQKDILVGAGTYWVAYKPDLEEGSAPVQVNAEMVRTTRALFKRDGKFDRYRLVFSYPAEKPEDFLERQTIARWEM